MFELKKIGKIGRKVWEKFEMRIKVERNAKSKGATLLGHRLLRLSFANLALFVVTIFAYESCTAPSSNTPDPPIEPSPYVCANGTPSRGLIDSPNIENCAKCESDLFEKVKLGTEEFYTCLPKTARSAYGCRNGVAAKGDSFTSGRENCYSCVTVNGIRKEPVNGICEFEDLSYPYACTGGTPVAGVLLRPNVENCEECNEPFTKIEVTGDDGEKRTVCALNGQEGSAAELLLDGRYTCLSNNEVVAGNVAQNGSPETTDDVESCSSCDRDTVGTSLSTAQGGGTIHNAYVLEAIDENRRRCVLVPEYSYTCTEGTSVSGITDDRSKRENCINCNRNGSPCFYTDSEGQTPGGNCNLDLEMDGRRVCNLKPHPYICDIGAPNPGRTDMAGQRKCVDCSSNLNFELVDGGCRPRPHRFTCTNGTAVAGHTSGPSNQRHSCSQGSCAVGSRFLGRDAEGRNRYCCLRTIISGGECISRNPTTQHCNTRVPTTQRQVCD